MSRADALTAEQAEHAPHFCQNEHAPIRHWDSENERCPLCRARDALNAIDELWYEDAGKADWKYCPECSDSWEPKDPACGLRSCPRAASPAATAIPDSPTPRTDACLRNAPKHILAQPGQQILVTPAPQLLDLARQLERELAGLQAMYRAACKLVEESIPAPSASTAATAMPLSEDDEKAYEEGRQAARETFGKIGEQLATAKAARSTPSATPINESASQVPARGPRYARDVSGSLPDEPSQLASADSPPTTTRVLKDAEAAIDLFLEYRDKHGHDEDAAKAAALNEFAEAESEEVRSSISMPDSPRVIEIGLLTVSESGDYAVNIDGDRVPGPGQHFLHLLREKETP